VRDDRWLIVLLSLFLVATIMAAVGIIEWIYGL
jgi:hypothetical protein